MLKINPGTELVNSIKSDMTGVSGDLTEVAIDTLLNEGALKDIPVIGTLKALFSVTVNIKDYFYLKKVLIFLSELNRTTLREREKFIANNLAKDSQVTALGEKLLLLLERSDDIEKAKIYGKIIRHSILNNVTQDQAFRLCYMVDKAYLGDVFALTEYFNETRNTDISPEDMDPFIAAELQKAGLLTFSGIDGGNSKFIHSGGIVYYLNKHGRKLVEILNENANEI
ncbi:hypothetical protein [Allochromatium vinosum]|uniref:hypothetical protein n=1 Tax=Allochromatium vinosum TaxID=1049 RepID=UPI00190423E7|nr:hypothetical protein [Allochromatium vinosum]